MKTITLKGGQAEDIARAAELLRQGELVAFPTETVYGLGADAINEEAVKGIYQAKGRPSDNPLIVHIYQREQLFLLAREISTVAELLIERFWPGPLTLIFPKTERVPSCITGGLDTVAVRMPSHPVALDLLQACGLPIAAPSANRSGKPSPTTAEHVLYDLSGRIAAVVDGGTAAVGLESTVLDITRKVPVILRPGGITREQLEAVIGPVEVAADYGSSKETPRAPGMKYTHYAPEAPVKICRGNRQQVAAELQQKLQDSGQQRVGLMLSRETLAQLQLPEHVLVAELGSFTDLPGIASGLFAALRSFDQAGVDMIYTEAFPCTDMGAALMNRLDKAAGTAPAETVPEQ